MGEEQVMSDQLLLRIDELEDRTDAIRRELADLRDLVARTERAPTTETLQQTVAKSVREVDPPAGSYRQPLPSSYRQPLPDYGDAVVRAAKRFRERPRPDLSNVDLL